MQKRCLGNSAIEVSVIGLGTVKFGRNQGVKYPTSFSLPTDIELERLLALAAELGINLLDTAPAYGTSEERLGKLLKNQRANWVISTKVGEEFNEGVSFFDFSTTAIRKSIERSLKRLHTDYLDVVMIHSDGNDEKIIHQTDAFAVLSELKQKGLIRSFGMSTKTLQGGLQALAQSDMAMVTFNPAHLDERDVIKYAHEHQKGIFIKKALASGHIDQIVSVKDALNFILAEPGVTSIILGTINPKHLRENIAALS